MADVDRSAGAVRRVTCNSEQLTLLTWDADIRRAARTRARGRRNAHVLADELAQAARLRVLAAVRQRGDLPQAYLRTVIANAVATPLTRDRALEMADQVPLDLVDEEAAGPADHLAVEAVQQWLPNLPAPLQRVYHLLFVEGHSQREAALLMQVSQPRIAQMLRALLERGSTGLASIAA